MRQSAQGRSTRMTLRDGMGREVGGGFRMGDTYTPMADSCQCMAKPLQYCKVISLQLNKFEKKVILKINKHPAYSHVSCLHKTLLDFSFPALFLRNLSESFLFLCSNYTCLYLCPYIICPLGSKADLCKPKVS